MRALALCVSVVIVVGVQELSAQSGVFAKSVEVTVVSVFCGFGCCVD